MPELRLRGRRRRERGADPRARADAGARRDARAAGARGRAAALRRPGPALPGARGHARARRPRARRAAVRAPRADERAEIVVAGPRIGITKAVELAVALRPRRLALPQPPVPGYEPADHGVDTSCRAGRDPRAAPARRRARVAVGEARTRRSRCRSAAARAFRSVSPTTFGTTPWGRARHDERHLVVRRERAALGYCATTTPAAVRPSPACRRTWASAAARRALHREPRPAGRRRSARRPRSACSPRAPADAREHDECVSRQ